MKKILTLIALLPVLAMAQEKESFYLGAGATMNNTTGDMSDRLGYYITAGTTGRLTERSGYLGEIQYSKQSAGTQNLSVVNAAFAYRLFVWKLSLDAGVQIGVYAADNVSTEVNKLSKGRMDVIGGLQLQVSKRIIIQTRYAYHLSDLPFKGLAQVGVAYGF